MTNEEYEREIIAFLEKTKTMNDQKVKKVLGDIIDEIELKKLDGQKKELVNRFTEKMNDFYHDLRTSYESRYNIIIDIDDDEYDTTFKDLGFKGTWRTVK